MKTSSGKGTWIMKEWKKWKWKSLSHVRLFATPRTVAHQAPLSMDFSRSEHQSGSPLILQGVFPTQESSPGFPHCRQILTDSPALQADSNWATREAHETKEQQICIFQ